MKLFSILFFSFLWTGSAQAVPLQTYWCDPCTNEKISCYQLNGNYSYCPESCNGWRPNCVYVHSNYDANCMNGSCGSASVTGTATFTATAIELVTPTPALLDPEVGIGTATATSIGIGPPPITPTPPPLLPCTVEGHYRPGGTGACQCPPNYSERGGACRPDAPLFKGRTTSDFFISSDDISKNYPVCGPKRIAVMPSGAPLNVSSNSWPNSSSEVQNTTGPGPYKYAKSVNGLPEYLYPPGSWCACTFKDFPSSAAGQPGAVTESNLKIPPDTFAAISSVTASNNAKTSPVAIAHDSTGTIDPRPGDQFAGAVPKSSCGCADLNAEAVALDPGNPNVPQGAYCRSMIPDSDPHRVLVEFNPAIHDIPGATQVIKRNEQPQLENMITTAIALPIKTGAAATKPYRRRIWACSNGFTVDVNAVPPVCIFDASKHKCGPSGNGALASAMPTGVSGNTLDIIFANSKNKKNGCCSAEVTKGFFNEKMDCIDNSKKNYASFDELWASSDDLEDGGQLNAIVLTNAAGMPISGFYRLNGSRCNGKSEFGGTLQPALVNPGRAITGQVLKADAGMSFKGSPLPLPSGSGAAAYASLQNLGGVPTTVEDRLECPILVRAAIKVECEGERPLPAKQTTYVQAGGSGSSPNKTRCTVAKNIFYHTQVRQLTEIAGMKTLKTFDTIQKPDAAAKISIKNILEKQNTECGSNMKRVGDDCVYQ